MHSHMQRQTISLARKYRKWIDGEAEMTRQLIMDIAGYNSIH